MRLSLFSRFARSIVLITAITAVSPCLYATEQWIPEIDRKYQYEYPDLFEKTMKVKLDLTRYAGGTEVLQDASVALKEVLDTNPEFAPAYVQAARLYTRLGMLPGGKVTDEALQVMEELLQAALQIEPDYGYAYAQLAFTYRKMKNLDEAERYLALAEGTGTTFPLLQHEKAAILYARENYAEAIRILKAGFEKYKQQPDIAISYAETIINCAKKLKDPEDPPEYWYKVAIELKPENAWPLGNYASYLFYVKNDYAQAAEYGERALEIMDYGMGRYVLAAAYYGLWTELDDIPGRKDEALSYFQKAVALYPDTDEHLKNFQRSRSHFNIFAKLINYNIKVKNARKDLEAGRITQAEHDEQIATPYNQYVQ